MIKERVLTGSFNFELFVETMQNDGYITEINAPDEISLGSTAMESTNQLQEEFNELFKFFYPKYLNDIKLRCVASNEGMTYQGCYSYALLNEKVVSSEEVMDALKKENQQIDEQL